MEKYGELEMDHILRRERRSFSNRFSVAGLAMPDAIRRKPQRRSVGVACRPASVLPRRDSFSRSGRLVGPVRPMIVTVPVVGVATGSQGKTLGIVVAAGAVPAGRLGRGCRPTGRLASVVTIPLSADVVGSWPAAAWRDGCPFFVVVVPPLRLAVVDSDHVRRRQPGGSRRRCIQPGVRLQQQYEQSVRG